MTDVEVSWATDDDVTVDALLGEWKGKDRGGDRYLYLVARSGDTAVGVLEGHHDWANWRLLEDWQHLSRETTARGSYVSSIYVVPDARGQGVGAALMNQFERSARDSQRPVMIAWPDEDEEGRAERLSFFVNQGFGFARFPGGAREPWLMAKALR
jgi:GNAT superfamily N-acetyltransferase